MGVPNAYPAAYLMTAVSNAAQDAIDRLEETHIGNVVTNLYAIVCMIIGIIMSLRFSESFFGGLFEIFVFVITSVLVFKIYAWVAKKVVHAFHFTLTGVKGWAINGCV